jgi:hypothetical protein
MQRDGLCLNVAVDVPAHRDRERSAVDSRSRRLVGNDRTAAPHRSPPRVRADIVPSGCALCPRGAEARIGGRHGADPIRRENREAGAGGALRCAIWRNSWPTRKPTRQRDGCHIETRGRSAEVARRTERDEPQRRLLDLLE